MFRLALLISLFTAAAPESLLQGAETSAPPRLTDCEVASEGDGWRAREAAVIRPGRWPTWDLGAARSLAGGALQGDGNDAYVLSVSDDSATFTDVHVFSPTTGSGLRTRSGTFEARGRYVRLRAEGGDGLYSVSELQLFETRTALWTSELGRPGPRIPLFFPWVGLFVAVAVALGLVDSRASRARVAVVGLALAAIAVAVVAVTLAEPKVEQETIDWIRAVVAGSALLALGRVASFRATAPAHGGLVTGILSVAAGLAVFCFLNFGQPQFRDVGRDAPTFLHHYDMRAYFPIAKYFPEVRFDGVYAASAAVVLEDVGPNTAILTRPMTNLRTHERPTIGESEAYIREVRARFSDERWRAFVEDMGYFRRAMTDGGFLGTMQDHGGNATPVWFLGARAVFAHAPASDAALWAGVAVDVALMLLAFASIAWAFGGRTALLAAIVWGAMDLYMFGSNWFGAALRHDWMALWAVGLALLKKERFAAAGGVLAWAGLIRVFPIASFLTIAVPFGFALAADVAAKRRGFSPRAFLAEQRGFVRFCGGALVAGLSLLALSVYVFGVDAWPDWARKISLMARGRGINTVGLTNFTTDPIALNTAVALILVAGAWALRRAPLHEAATFGVVLLAPLFSPMNYYLHSLYLLVLLGNEERILPWFAALAMCVGCYFTTLLDGGFERHFDAEALNVLVVGAVILGAQMWRSVRRVDGEEITAAMA